MLTINIDGLQNKAIPAMEKTRKSLKSAHEILIGISIPNDFRYRNKLSKLIERILDVDDEIYDTRKWVEEKIESLINVEAKNKEIVNIFGGSNTITRLENKDEESKVKSTNEPSNDIIFDKNKKDGSNTITRLENKDEKTKAKVQINREKSDDKKTVREYLYDFAFLLNEQAKAEWEKVPNHLEYANGPISKYEAAYMTDEEIQEIKEIQLELNDTNPVVGILDGVVDEDTINNLKEKKMKRYIENFKKIEEIEEISIISDIQTEILKGKEEKWNEWYGQYKSIMGAEANLAHAAILYEKCERYFDGFECDSYEDEVKIREFFISSSEKIGDEEEEKWNQWYECYESIMGDEANPAHAAILYNEYEDSRKQKQKEEKTLGEYVEEVGASAANLVIGFTEGVADFGEGIFDTASMIGVGAGSIFTLAWDGGAYLGALITGTTDEWSSATCAMWKAEMSFVATDYVGEAYDSFYENTSTGQWLDETAADTFKSTGAGYQMAKGLGEVTGIAVTSVLTGGSSAVIAGMSAFGKYTEEAWGGMRDSSMEGIERKYKNGEISEEEYQAIKAVKNMTDEEWQEIKQAYRAGEISKEEYKQIKAIREIPDEWTTAENFGKGIGYGGANAIWEAVQYKTGEFLSGNLAKKLFKNARPAVAIGIDTVFNAGDTAFRAGVETLFITGDWNESWNNQGGWSSVLVNTGVGLIGSIGGEIKEFKAKRKNVISENAGDGIDKSLKNAQEIVDRSKSNTTKLSKKFDKVLKNDNLKLIDKLENLEKIAKQEGDEYFYNYIIDNNLQDDYINEVFYDTFRPKSNKDYSGELGIAGKLVKNKLDLAYDEKLSNRILGLVTKESNGNISKQSLNLQQLYKSNIGNYDQNTQNVINKFLDIATKDDAVVGLHITGGDLRRYNIS